MKGQANKRRVTTNGPLRLEETPKRPPTPPSKHAASAPISKFQVRHLSKRPLPSVTGPSRDKRQNESTAANTTTIKNKDFGLQDRINSEPQRYKGRRSFQFDFRTPENIKPSHFGRASTDSLPRNGSPVFTSPPGSASLSQSNSSTAPILPSQGAFNASSSSRNKLVKRSSSQRALSVINNSHSTLRRPATSHQRSATLLYQYQEPDHSLPTTPTKEEGKDENGTGGKPDDSLQQWKPFFKSQVSRTSIFGSAAKRKFPGGTSGSEVTATVVPDLTELPTLLLATSIGSHFEDPEPGRRLSRISHLSQPFTPTGFHHPKSNLLKESGQDSEQTIDIRPRTSFSLSDVFSSPSPLSWKGPNTGSLRGKKLLGKRLGGRRIVSAPTSTRHITLESATDDNRMLGNHTQIYATSSSSGKPLKTAKQPQGSFQRQTSSTLPALTRLSSFKLNLPETIPSYPTTPGRKESPPLPHIYSGPGSPPSPLGHLPRRSQVHQPSGAHSDHASTLLGSDAENSRFFSGDEDDIDGRSSTAYDSMRTGATDNSQTSRKRLHIDAIFKESPPLKPPRGDLLRLDDLNIANLKIHATTNGEISANEKFDGLPSSIEMSRHPASSPDFQTRSDLRERNESRPTDRQGSIEDNIGSRRASKTLNEDPLLATRSSHNNSLESQAEGAISVAEKDHQQGTPRSQRDNPKRRESPPAGLARTNPFAWSEQSSVERESGRADSGRPKTVQGRQGKDLRGHRSNSRRALPPLHLRSQSVPVPSENRAHSNTTNLETWALGKHGPSEDWDGDFDFEEPSRLPKPVGEGMRASLSSGMLVPKSIMDNQASVHGQFGQVKELTKLVEELKRLQMQARAQGIMEGQAAELWREAEGIINLATIDDEEHDLQPPISPSREFDLFDEDSPSNQRRRSGLTPPKDETPYLDQTPIAVPSASASSRDGALHPETPPSSSRPRKESSAKAKSVLENIHQQRLNYDHALLDAKLSQKKLPFDTTSLKDLVTRAGVVTRALKEEIRRAENRNDGASTKVEYSNDRRPGTPPDPPFSQVLFQKPSPSQPFSRSSRVAQSPKSPKSSRSSVLGGSISGNDYENNGQMKVMTVV